MKLHEEETICFQCNNGFVTKEGSIGTGYGYNKDGHKICYACCGENDKNELQNMKLGEKTCLYLSVKDNHENKMKFGQTYCVGNATVTNWPGTYKKSVGVKKGFHNIAGVRYDIWFTEGKNYFHGVRYGSDSEICYITCVKPF